MEPIQKYKLYGIVGLKDLFNSKRKGVKNSLRYFEYFLLTVIRQYGIIF